MSSFFAGTGKLPQKNWLAVFGLLFFLSPALSQALPPRLESVACSFSIPQGNTAKCWILHVPENRSKPDSAEISLPVALLSTPDQKEFPDPILYLDGGPGYSANLIRDDIDDWWDWIELTTWNRKRDLLLLDQRGTKSANPALYCRDFFDGKMEQLAKNGLPLKQWKEMLRKLAGQCQQQLQAAHIDLTAYNSLESAADIADLLRLMQIQQINIYGISYGTKLALTFMRDYPQYIRSVILDSVYPPEVDSFVDAPAAAAHAFQRLFKDCRADDRCNQRYPDLEKQFLELYQQLEKQPLQIEVEKDGLKKARYIIVTSQTLVLMIFQGLYDSANIRKLPRLIYQLFHGEEQLASAFVQDLLASEGTQFSYGMYFSFECGEEYPSTDFNRQKIEIDRYKPYSLAVADYYDLNIVCPFWHSTNSQAALNSPVYSSIPTLILSGSYDPITPLNAAKLTASRLENSYFFEFPDVGHGVVPSNSCADTLADVFLDQPSLYPVHPCLGALERPDFR